MDLSNARWRTSSYTEQGNCVEVAFVPGLVGVRDTKNRAGGTLAFTENAWRAFTGLEHDKPHRPQR
jgi:Domain of unknown function (DUF397)